MSAASVMLVMTAHVAREQPLHELIQCGLVRRFEHEVKVIRHHVETEYFYSDDVSSLQPGEIKGFVVLRL
jgi:hypothetical protein